MNIMHLKYAVEVAKTGTISKASESLLVGQPNLSRAIKELEHSLGITIFYRTAKGMVITPDGERFLNYARSILQQIEYVESIYNDDTPKKQKFSISVPRLSYIAEAFANFSKTIDTNPAELIYMETNAMRTIENIIHADYKLGILRYPVYNEQYYYKLLEGKNLAGEKIADFNNILLMSRHNPLALKDNGIYLKDLNPYIEIIHADQYVPSLPTSGTQKKEAKDYVGRRIYVFERASRFELLAENNETFMKGAPLPEKLLKRYDLVQRKCIDEEIIYRDVLIYRQNYRFTDLDIQFINQLNHTIKQCL